MPTDLSVMAMPLPVLLLGAALALAGCASDDGLVKPSAEAIGLATTPQQAKAFVRESRPAQTDYIPVGQDLQSRQLCPGPTPPPPYAPAGQAARFKAPTPIRDPKDPCKPRANFETIQQQLEAKQKINEAAGNTAKALGTSAAPKPAQIPTN
jgi:hypothetical protein